MTSVEEAISLLKKNIVPVRETESCDLSDSYGRVLSSDLYAPINVPPFAKSAMDGYAVNSSDITSCTKENPVVLEVADELFAGDWKNIPYKKNTAVRVMTGSPIPEGFDSVVMQENTDYGEKKVSVYKAVKPFENYCEVGEDIKKDSLVLHKDTKIGRTELALLASLGITKVSVYRKLRLSVLCTGSELVAPGYPLEEGKIYSSIGAMISASAKNIRVEVVREKLLSDDEKLIQKEILSSLSDSDLIVTTGGVSVGKKDLLPSVLEKLGAKKIFSHVNIQPGTPTMASALDGKIILSLSGNPYAAFANFDIYFYHAVSALLQCDDFLPVQTEAVLSSDYEKVNKLRRFVRANLVGNKVYLPSNNHSSSVIANLTKCNCYIDVPPETKLKTGQLVQVLMMGD